MDTMIQAIKMTAGRIIAVLVLAVPVLGGCGNRFAMPPEVPASAGDDVQRRLIPYVHGQLEMFETHSAAAAHAEPRAMVLEFTGGDAADAARLLAWRWRGTPVAVWAINYPGYGHSTGPRTLEALAHAALDAVDTQRRIARQRPIIVEGFRLGVAPALHVAANRKVEGIVLQTPTPPGHKPPRRWSIWKLKLPAWPKKQTAAPPGIDCIEAARQATAPAVILINESDATAPIEFQQQLADAYAGPKRVIRCASIEPATPMGEEQQRQLDEAMEWLMSQASAAINGSGS